MPALATRIDADLPGHVHRVLADYVESRRRQTDSIGTDVGDALAALADFVLGGGKRVRPTFAWWGWRGAGGDQECAAVLRAISALELLQAGALVHDDLMDSSLVRRGAPTLHVAFAARHRAGALRGEPERFGLAAAVLLGDIALAWAEDLFLTAGLAADALARAVLVDVGAVDAVEQRIAELTTSALDTLAAAPIAAPAADRLAELAVHTTRRDR